MGWLFQRDKLRRETPVQYITREFTHTDGTRHATVIDAAAVGNTIYAAIRNTNTVTGQSYVFCAVILFKNNSRDGFGYKDMDEGMGPCQIDCPDRIMKQLSPIAELPDPGFAAKWRASVAEAKARRKNALRQERKLQPGDRIRLPTPAHFRTSGIAADTFTVIAIYKRTPILAPIGYPDFRCRLPRQTLALAIVET